MHGRVYQVYEHELKSEKWFITLYWEIACYTLIKSSSLPSLYSHCLVSNLKSGINSISKLKYMVISKIKRNKEGVLNERAMKWTDNESEVIIVQKSAGCNNR